MNQRAASIELPERLVKPAKPYPGLRPFEPHEWPIFFGRDQMVDDVVAQLTRNRIVFIHGASGSGKSSLVRAGVIPRLARKQQRDGITWRGCIMRPSGGPIWNLARAFAEVTGQGSDLDRIEQIARLFYSENTTLSDVAASLENAENVRICILIDQFEELFRFAKETSAEEADAFVGLLTREFDRAVDASRVYVVLTMRSEFLGQCARFQRFAELINKTAYLVPRMEEDAIRRAIKRPSELYRGRVEPALVDRLVSEAARGDDELPLIQHALMLIWNDAKAKCPDGETIRLDTHLLTEAGGVRALLSKHADSVLSTVAPDSKQLRITEEIFRALTDFNSDGFAIRRPQKFDALVSVSGASEIEVEAILDGFEADGVSFITRYTDILGKNPIIDISHEAVIRCWEKICDEDKGWLIKEFRDGQIWRSLVFQAKSINKEKEMQIEEKIARYILNILTLGKLKYLNNYKKLDYLPLSITEEVDTWITGRNKSWAARYGNEWENTVAAVDRSREAMLRLKKARKINKAIIISYFLMIISIILYAIYKLASLINSIFF